MFPGAKGLVANTGTKLLIYRLFQKARVLAQDGIQAGMATTNQVQGWLCLLMTEDSSFHWRTKPQTSLI